MASTRKRRRIYNPSANRSSPSPSQYPASDIQSTQENQTKTNVRNETETQDSPSSTQPPAQQATDEEELERARKVAANAVSSTYKLYLVPELSKHVDKHGRRMIAYTCRICGDQMNRPTYDSSCSNLKKHASNCHNKQNESNSISTLANVGIKGTGDISPKEVPQLCAVWCAEAARPFSALVGLSHQAILHPTVVKNLPTRRMVSNDIHMLYSAIQENYKSVLAAHTGALYLGVNAWQSPNGFGILGIVIYRLAGDDLGDAKLEAMPLGFVRLSQSHTGVYLADAVRLVVEKFGIQHKICGIVSDNATNNDVMVRELKKQKWARFKGEPQWVRCFAHVLNLIVQGILRPFGTQKRTKAAQDPEPNQADGATQDPNEADGDESDDSESGYEDTEAQIRFFHPDRDESDEDDDASDIEPPELDRQVEPSSDLLSLEDIKNPCQEDEGDCYTTNGCKQSLAKFRAIAKKLKYSPNSKSEFVEICRKKGCETPHTVECDVRTWWNSTLIQVNSILRCEDAILEWQRHKRHGVDREYFLDTSDFDLARDLAHVLNLFYEITLQISTSGLARLSNIVDSYWDEYFKLVNWEPEWIVEAIGLTREMWVNFYKPAPIAPTPSSSATKSSKPKSSMLAGLSGAAAARGGICSTALLDIWLAGGLILDDNEPVNPLKWWIQQKKSGNTHGGLAHMALDVLSCPATSVDVERAFSFGGDYVSPRRHRLSARSLSRGMTVAFYSKNGLIKDGVLARWKGKIQDQKKFKTKEKLRAKEKGKSKIIVLDEE
ncbi:hypothetical protein PSTG_15398 [Puccinia striiformis f. sp. tritici PST-78]|uniref:HAT C-terminal dimerisation domain-containing protein n=1 Tax=Puccinia striiformis f. sp. tritici PST-78 TaxID=1165861 RepID=A0A0L0UVS1_9BASI|nr:hypothetical protein PSTG_15398 [Puccinia striiformis f. sp. tritici PST-78]